MKFIFFFCFFLFTSSLYAQIITTIAGNGTYGYSGNGGPATSAQLAWEMGIVTDNSGNLYIADFDNNVVRKVNSAGIISNFAGNGTLGFTGDGGLATAAHLYHPAWINMDQAGNLYIIDQNGEVIRKVNTAGIITTITGNLPPGYSGDGGPLIAAKFHSLSGISFDKAGNMYISDHENFVIRKVNSAGIITTVAGNGTSGFSGDGAAATSAQLNGPYAVAFDNAGNIFIPDNGNSRIRKVTPDGIITTIAGTGILGDSGDGGPATSADLYYPWTITIDNKDNLYIGDAGNYTVRKIDPSGIISIFAGNSTYGNNGDGGPAVAAQLGEISGVAVDNAGNVYVSVRDYFYVVKKINTCLAATINRQPVNDTICAGSKASFVVAANNGGSYQWQQNTGNGWSNVNDNIMYSGAVTDTLYINNASASMSNYQYRCIVTNTCGYIYSDSARLTVTGTDMPTVTITTASDTVCAASNTFFTATAVNAGQSPTFQWKKNNINIATGGPTYMDTSLKNGDVISCVLTSTSACGTKDTVTSNAVVMTITSLLTPVIAISASANNICSRTPVTFTAVAVNGGASPIFLWKKNGTPVGGNAPLYTDSLLNENDSITCFLTSNNKCLAAPVSASNTITMSVNSLASPSVIISTTTASICAGAAVTYTAAVANAGLSPLYKWKKNGLPAGTGNSSYTEKSILDGDIITCTITANGNCMPTPYATSNAIIMTVFDAPVVLLDKTPTLCTGSTRQLDAGDYAAYLWNDNSKTRFLSVNSPGTYFATVTDSYGCKGSDTAIINMMLPAPKNFLPQDTAICSYGSISLNAQGGYQNYLWSNNQNTPSINITNAGLYWLQVTDNSNCRGRDSILVASKDCLKGFYIPSAFSPNNDGKNDLFKPLLFGNVTNYQLIIYNRYGQVIFKTTDAARGWDGTINGTIQNGNAFVWACTYQFAGEPQQVKRGTVLLVR